MLLYLQAHSQDASRCGPFNNHHHPCSQVFTFAFLHIGTNTIYWINKNKCGNGRPNPLRCPKSSDNFFLKGTNFLYWQYSGYHLLRKSIRHAKIDIKMLLGFLFSIYFCRKAPSLLDSYWREKTRLNWASDWPFVALLISTFSLTFERTLDSSFLLKHWVFLAIVSIIVTSD